MAGRINKLIAITCYYIIFLNPACSPLAGFFLLPNPKFKKFQYNIYGLIINNLINEARLQNFTGGLF